MHLVESWVRMVKLILCTRCGVKVNMEGGASYKYQV